MPPSYKLGSISVFAVCFPHINSGPRCNRSLASFSKPWLGPWLCFLKEWAVLISPGFQLLAQPGSKAMCFSCCSSKVLSGSYLQTRNRTFAVWSSARILLLFLMCGAIVTSLCTAGAFVQSKHRFYFLPFFLSYCPSK